MCCRILSKLLLFFATTILAGHFLLSSSTVVTLQVFMRTMSILTGKPSAESNPMAMLPWDIGSPSKLQQTLIDTHFRDATCTAFQHPLHIEMPDMVKLVVGPHSQFAPMLDRMKASGRENVYAEAAQVFPCCLLCWHAFYGQHNFTNVNFDGHLMLLEK